MNLVEHASVGFANGSGGHVVSFTGGPSAGQLDVVTVNSNTVVTTPTGFTVGRSRVNSQGSYLYYRFAVGGEPASVTITTAGDHSTVATWSRWSGAAAFDVAVDNGVDSSAGLTTPTQSTGALAGTGELVIAVAALHNLSAGLAPSSPAWSTGFTALDAASEMTGPGGDGAHVAAFTGYKTGAGTAAESPNVTWTNNANDRYLLVAAFTAAPVPDSSVIARPSTGITARPRTGTITRPNTGIITRP
jgi:hypothetical protein